MAKTKLTQEKINAEVERKLAEARAKWMEDHTPKISMKFGNTYIVFAEFDYITQTAMEGIHSLLNLMSVAYSTCYPFADDRTFSTIINGEDTERTAFIQKYIDNNYRLDWRK